MIIWDKYGIIMGLYIWTVRENTIMYSMSDKNAIICDNGS